MLAGAPTCLITLLESVSGNRSCYRETHSTDDVHTKADANIMLLCAIRYANIKLACVVPTASKIKCYIVREILATIVTHAIGRRTQANVYIISLCYMVPNFIYLKHVPGK